MSAHDPDGTYRGGILIANRGEIAVRIARTARELGYRAIAIYSSADRGAPHVGACDDAYFVGEAPASESYLNAERILAIAREAGVWAIHPGYGFLSERPEFADACERAGIVFIGPSAEAMRALGDKARAKRTLEPHGIPFVPGYHGEDQSEAAFAEAACAIGMPLLVKAAAGGGGRGMRLVHESAALPAALASARAEAAAAFGDGTLLLERAILRPRHIEVQIAADAHGNVAHLGERECSVQRRYQKIVEESPSSAVDASLRERMGEAAIAIARLTGYRGLGTIEFLLDENGAFYFIEANARLQVEHPVTEARARVDLVEWQIAIARGEPLPDFWLSERTFAIEVRLCAEDARAGFVPQTGTIALWQAPAGVRVDHALRDGLEVGEHYDSMLAKLIASGPTRDRARRALVRALDELVLFGLETNAAALRAILGDEAFARGETTTAFLAERAEALEAELERAPARELAAVLAAASAYRCAAERSGFGAWSSWSANLRPAAALVFADARDGERLELRIECGAPGTEALRVSCAGRTYALAFGEAGPSQHPGLRLGSAQVRAAGEGTLETAETLRFAYAESGEMRYLAARARTFAFRDLSRVPAAALAAGAGDGALRAPTGGRVLAVHAVAGERLAPKAVAVVLEAMKMEHAVALPVEATVREVTVAPGERVERGAVLLRYDP